MSFVHLKIPRFEHFTKSLLDNDLKARVGLAIAVVLVLTPYYIFGMDSYVRVHDWGEERFSYWIGDARLRSLDGSTGWHSRVVSGFSSLAGGYEPRLEYIISQLSPQLFQTIFFLILATFSSQFVFSLARRRMMIDLLPSFSVSLLFCLTFYQIQMWRPFAFLPMILFGITSRNWTVGIAISLTSSVLVSGMSVYAFSIYLIPSFIILTLVFSDIVDLKKSILFISIYIVSWAFFELDNIYISLVISEESHRSTFLRLIERDILWLWIRHLDRFVWLFILPVVAVILLPTIRTKVLLFTAVSILLFISEGAYFFIVRRVDNLPDILSGINFRIWPAGILAASIANAFALHALGAFRLSILRSPGGGSAFQLHQPMTYVYLIGVMYVGAVHVTSATSELVKGASARNLYAHPALLKLEELSASSRHAYRVIGTALFPRIDVLPDPALGAYGMRRAGGYVNIYPGAYKQLFRPAIERSLQNDGRLTDYYDKWGSRLGLLLSTDVVEEYCGKWWWRSCAIDLERIADVDVLRTLNVGFIASSFELRSPNITPIVLDNIDYQKQKEDIYLLNVGTKQRNREIVNRIDRLIRGNDIEYSPIYIYSLNDTGLFASFYEVAHRVNTNDYIEAVDVLSFEVLSKRLFVTSDDVSEAEGLPRSVLSLFSRDGNEKSEVAVEISFVDTGIDMAWKGDRGDWLLVRENFSNFWSATDQSGAELRIVRALGSFMAIETRDGSTSVHLRYKQYR